MTLQEKDLKTKTKYIPFNIGSRQQISDRLQELGWKPKSHTDKGNVIVNEEVLNSIDLEEAKKFARYLLLQKELHRLNLGLNRVMIRMVEYMVEL